MKQSAIGVIPARYGSQRFRGKILADLCGKPLIQRVYENARRATCLETVLVATDDDRIAEACKRFGAPCVMTPPQCPSGTDRVALACRDYPADIVVNIQGDEPFIPPSAVDLAVNMLRADSSAQAATLVYPARNLEDVHNPNKVKAVLDAAGNAIYFSRSPVPYVRDPEEFGQTRYWLHIGLYVYRRDFLYTFVQTAPSFLERAEKLEQLRILENGYRIKAACIEYQGIGIDTMDDLQKAVELLCQNSSS